MNRSPKVKPRMTEREKFLRWEKRANHPHPFTRIHDACFEAWLAAKRQAARERKR